MHVILGDALGGPASTAIKRRSLKIESSGDIGYREVVKPKIRLVGNWLKRAGFHPGDRVQVIELAPGIIELRSGPQLELTL